MPSGRWHNVKPTAALFAFSAVRQNSSPIIIRNPFAIGRELRKMAVFSDRLTLTASKRWHDVDPSSVPVRPKNNLAAVWRKRRLTVIGFMAGYPDGLTTGNLLNPDVEISCSASIGGIGQKLSVLRNRRIGSQP
jgi:hypothetical protein